MFHYIITKRLFDPCLYYSENIHSYKLGNVGMWKLDNSKCNQTKVALNDVTIPQQSFWFGWSL